MRHEKEINMKNKFLLTTTASAILLSLSYTAQSYPRHDPNVFDGGNLWSITFYNDSATTHTQWATQHICFLPYSVVGTHIRGKWYSTSYPNWHGHYSQEGDSVKMVGNFWNGRGNDGMSFDIVTNSRRNMAAGHWTEWGDNGRFGPVYGFGNTKLERIGNCFTHSDAEDVFVEARKLKNGEDASFPQQLDQIEITSPLKYEEWFTNDQK